MKKTTLGNLFTKINYIGLAVILVLKCILAIDIFLEIDSVELNLTAITSISTVIDYIKEFIEISKVFGIVFLVTVIRDIYFKIRKYRSRNTIINWLADIGNIVYIGLGLAFYYDIKKILGTIDLNNLLGTFSKLMEVKPEEKIEDVQILAIALFAVTALNVLRALIGLFRSKYVLDKVENNEV